MCGNVGGAVCWVRLCRRCGDCSAWGTGRTCRHACHHCYHGNMRALRLPQLFALCVCIKPPFIIIIPTTQPHPQAREAIAKQLMLPSFTAGAKPGSGRKNKTVYRCVALCLRFTVLSCRQSTLGVVAADFMPLEAQCLYCLSRHFACTALFVVCVSHFPPSLPAQAPAGWRRDADQPPAHTAQAQPHGTQVSVVCLFMRTC